MPSVDQLSSLDHSIPSCRSFHLTNHRQTILKLYLLRKKNIVSLNDYLENLIDSYTIYLHPIERHLVGHELPFQWSSKLMEAMKLACSWRISFLPFFKNRPQFRNFASICEDSL